MTFSIVRRARRYDLLMLRYHPAQLLLIVTLRRAGHRIVLEVNGVAEDAIEAHTRLRPVRPLLRYILKRSCRKAHSVVAVTQDLQCHIQDISGLGDSVIWAANGTDVGRFQPAEPATRPPNVLFVGALTSWQGLPNLLAAATDPAWPPGVRLTIAGDGPLRSLVEACDSQNVCYLGRIPPKKVVEAYGLCSIAVSPKSSRSLATSRGLSPLKVAEAHAAGCALVVTDIRGQADMVRRAGSGIVVEPDNSAALAAAVGTLATNPSLRHGMMLAARRHATSNLSWDHTWHTIAAAVEDLP